MTYLLIKNAHIVFAVASGCFFIVRSIWSYQENSVLQQKWVKIVPHINDTFLLLTAIVLAILSEQYPWEAQWLGIKVVALLAYIGLGTMAIKRGKTRKTRGLFAISAVIVFVYMLGVALYKSPWSWAFLAL